MDRLDKTGAGTTIGPIAERATRLPIRITLLANAGLLVEGAGFRLAVDALHEPQPGPFSGLPPETIAQIRQDQANPLGQLDALLFTHAHGDHFSASLTEQSLRQDPVGQLWLPRAALHQSVNLEAVARTQSQQLHVLGQATHPTPQRAPLARQPQPDSEGVDSPQGGASSIEAFRLTHAGKAYAAVEHYGFLITLGGRSLLFAGDGTAEPEAYESILAGRPLDLAVLNPLFILLLAGRRLIQTVLKPRQILINHIPFADEDPEGLREQVRRDLERHGDHLPPALVLQDPWQQATL